MIRALILSFLLLMPGWSAEPAPRAQAAATAADWQAAPEQAADAAHAQSVTTSATAPQPAGVWSQVLGWVVGIGVPLAGLALRFAPAGGLIAGLGQPLLNLAWSALAPGHVQAAERKQVAMAQGMGVAMHLIEVMPKDGTLGDLKQALSQRLPADTREHVNAWITELEQRQLAARSTAT